VLVERKNIIRIFQVEDFPSVIEIYKQGIETNNATFENHIPDWKEWNEKFILNPRLVVTDNGRVVGWAMLSRISTRQVYAGVCEVSIYIHTGFQGKGIGRGLLTELVVKSEKNNIWTLQAGIFAENISSINLHISCGFRKVGYREKIRKMAGVWRDTVLFERRSEVAGI